ncbi:MAG: NAD(P)H-dependent oxidoreductase [Bacteroidetes bacterium]|nr:NAD(P)H-dependent oxidoreductase [Bacteroidota bacterium]
MKIATILGSLNKNGSCAHALNIVHDELQNSDNIELVIIDPNDYTLPFPGQSIPNSDENKLQHRISDVAGIIISTPEYHGSFSSIVKLIIENLGFPSVLSGKPVSLLGVAGGSIGAIKSLEQLRSVCSHVGSIVLPGPVSISNVHSVFDKDGNCLDVKVDQRLRSLANEMIKNAEKHIVPEHALEEQVRENL